MGNTLDNCCCSKPDIQYVDMQNFQDYTRSKLPEYHKYSAETKKSFRNTTDLSKKWTQYSSTQDEANA